MRFGIIFEKCNVKKREMRFEKSFVRKFWVERMSLITGGVEFVGEAIGDATGRDGSRSDRHQFHYVLPYHVGSGGSGSSDDCRE